MNRRNFLTKHFKIPDKWYIKVSRYMDNHPEIKYWRDLKGINNWYSDGFIYNDRRWRNTKLIGYTEISLEQFNNFVLKK